MSLSELIAHSPGLASDSGEPAFAEPWQAQAFALAVAMNEAGHFTWTEWAQTLSAELHKPGARDDASDYFDHWMAALEKLVSDKDFAPRERIDAVAAAWQRAARATPHGKPILLANDPEHGR